MLYLSAISPDVTMLFHEKNGTNMKLRKQSY